MATPITTVAGKGAPLNSTEFDNNFINLRDTADAAKARTDVLTDLYLFDTVKSQAGPGSAFDADMLDGKHDGEVAADTVDGFHASQAAGAGAVVATDADGAIALGSSGKVFQPESTKTIVCGPSAGAVVLAANCYASGASYYRKDIGQGASVIVADKSGSLLLYACSSGANPIASWDVYDGVPIRVLDADKDLLLNGGSGEEKALEMVGTITSLSGPSGSGSSVILATNCYRASGGWYRKNTSYTAALFYFDGTDAYIYKCSAGSNPVTGWDLINGGKVWHDKNDGASSTLDADLLDGLHGTGYFNIYDYIAYSSGRYVTDANDSACRAKAFTAYYHYSPYTNKPSESTSDGIILTYCYSSGYATQYWMSLDTGAERGMVWIRATTDGSTWSGWMRCAPKDGTFTPIVQGTTTAGSGTYTGQTGTYQIDGKWVLFDIAVSWTAHTGTGNIIVTGLPFTNQGIYAPVSIMADLLTYSGQLVAAVYPNAAYVYLFSQASGASLTAIPMDTSANVWIAGTYRRN